MNGEWNTEKTRVKGDTEYGYRTWDGEKGNRVDNMLEHSVRHEELTVLSEVWHMGTLWRRRESTGHSGIWEHCGESTGHSL